MTEEQRETRSVWEAMNGSPELLDLYGYYPTLHDANVTNIDVSFERKEITITFEYSDVIQKGPENDETSLATKIVMRWSRVLKADFRSDGNYVYHIDFQRSAKEIKTSFTHSFGIGGQIVSEDVEVISVNISSRHSVPDVRSFLHTLHLSFAE